MLKHHKTHVQLFVLTSSDTEHSFGLCWLSDTINNKHKMHFNHTAIPCLMRLQPRPRVLLSV